jgi:hypothetical protein
VSREAFKEKVYLFSDWPTGKTFSASLMVESVNWYLHWQCFSHENVGDNDWLDLPSLVEDTP